MFLKKLILLFLLIFSQLALFSNEHQKGTRTIKGTVKDKNSNETLPGAALRFLEFGRNTVSDSNGKYEITLPEGKCTIEVSYVGYQSTKIEVKTGSSQTVNIELRASTDLEEVTVVGTARDKNISGVNMGVEKMSIKEIRAIPALLGEVDVIRAIQLLPGVQATSEGSSGFSVRGGSPDQNLILLDNTPLYNASHLMGFFSVFNNDIVSNLELYKGDLPLKYGGRLSSVLDIQTIDDMPKKLTGTGGLGLISSRLMLQGPMGEKTSWMVGARRSYADLFLKLSSDKGLRDVTLYFYDMNAKISHQLSENDNIAFNAYYGRDAFGVDLFGYNYGNLASSLTWRHRYNSNLYSNISANVTGYDYLLDSNMKGLVMDWKSKIFDFMLRADFVHMLGESSKLNYGLSSTYHSLSPGIVTSPDYPNYKLDKAYGLEHGLYLSNEQKLSEKLLVKYGLRWSIMQNMGPSTVYQFEKDPAKEAKYISTDSTMYSSGNIYNTYQNIEPRVGAVYKFTDYSSVKANYARNVQYIQLANGSASGSPLDIWFLSSPNVKPQKVDMVSAGYFHNFKDNAYETSIEIYHKKQQNVVDFADHADLILNKKLEGEIRTGKGRNYGMEMMVRKNEGKLTGFINYTYSRSERTINEINNGETYLSPYDKPHTINIVANYELNPKFTLSGAWVYATGTPTTYPSGRMVVGEGIHIPIYSGRNQHRKPDYHRLDLSVTYLPNPKSTKKWKSEWNFSLYNAYGRRNTYMILFSQDPVTNIPYAENTYLFSFVPSITYNFKF